MEKIRPIGSEPGPYHNDWNLELKKLQLLWSIDSVVVLTIEKSLMAHFPNQSQFRKKSVGTTHFRLLFLSLFIALSTCGYAEYSADDLMQDLLTVEYWNKKIADRLPITYNHLLQGGYLSMPSARMGEEGQVGIGYAHVPPYRLYSLRVQPLPQLEVSGNYRIFHGVDDPILSPLGFGDFADKGANIKFALFRPEDSGYRLPGVAIGVEDCIGTRSFHAYYAVLTQVFLEQNLELSFGYGTKRLRGFFGGLNWMPFRHVSLPFIKHLSLTAEYDATAYQSKRREPHPKGRIKNSPFNFGIKARLLDYFDLSLAYIRGDALAFSVSAFYNFGTTTGFLPKIDDPLRYQMPKKFAFLQVADPSYLNLPNLIYPFHQQRLDILALSIFYDQRQSKVLRLTVLNETYWMEAEVRCRLNHLLAVLIPSDIPKVIVVVESEGFPIQEYHFQMDFLRQYHFEGMGEAELAILTPLKEVSLPESAAFTLLYDHPIGLFNFELTPKTYTLFGTARGKFKYALGLHASLNGFLPANIYYNLLFGCSFFTNLNGVNDYDRLNPSQLMHVQSDRVRYYKKRGLTLDQGYLQKSWNLSGGYYTRLAAGYFEEMYGGIASELLYYPLHSPWLEGWAAGVEAALVKKRIPGSLSFANKIRKLKGFTPYYQRFVGSQYFLHLYYNLECFQTSFKLSAGKFLANDWGTRCGITRYFPSGMQLNLWYTWTNGKDHVNGKTYYDKGVFISMPLDIFYTYSERSRWQYGMSAWLRDVGAEALTGMSLYEMISEQRQ